MLKGCQRRMIVVRTGKDTMFDEVYFVLKKDHWDESCMDESDIICEANRIINGEIGEIRQKNSRKRKIAEFIFRAITPFVAGLISSLVVIAFWRLFGI